MNNKKDILLESFGSELTKVDLNAIYGGGPNNGITQGTKLTQVPGGTTDDPYPDSDEC
jgi:hypothetical protein